MMVRGRVALSLVLGLSLLASLRVAVSAGHNSDSASVDTPVTVPAAIAVPATGYELQVVVFAKGYQYYRFNGSSWVNYNASAVLYHKKPKKATKLAAIGRHFYLTQPDALGGQPTWETLPEDGVPFSLVTGKAVARVTVDPNSIAWVLLNATNSEGDRRYFGDIAYIQRYNTSHGLGPNSTSGASVRDTSRSRYSANYAFYAPL